MKAEGNIAGAKAFCKDDEIQSVEDPFLFAPLLNMSATAKGAFQPNEAAEVKQDLKEIAHSVKALEHVLNDLQAPVIDTTNPGEACSILKPQCAKYAGIYCPTCENGKYARVQTYLGCFQTLFVYLI